MNKKPYFKIHPDGSVLVTHAPSEVLKIDYVTMPVRFAVRRDKLGLEIHGENFSTVIDLSHDDALSIILMLTYAVRELAYSPSTNLGSAGVKA